MVKPRDEFVRARFASELDRNFSVVASAGSGKTTAITERILSIARSPNAAEILPRLVVVTFTTDGPLRRDPIPFFRRSDFGAEVPREIAGVQPARDPPIRNDFARQAAKALKCRTLLVRGKANALVDL